MDGKSLEKIDLIIDLLRHERYQWKPVRRVYIPKKNGKLRPLGLPDWSDKLLQEVIRTILDAYHEPQFSDHSHGFREKRGCHTALRQVMLKGRGTKWFIEGDISACYDSIDHSILLNLLRNNFQDNRFIRLIENLLEAGYLEDWKFNKTYSGVPQGSIVGPILSNVVLDQLDRYIDTQIIPAHTRGTRRRTNPEYRIITQAASQARKAGDRAFAKELNQQAQLIPSKDPNDPTFRRLWYVRYADDWLIGLSGPKSEAMDIKLKIASFLEHQLKLKLSEEKTLITHARDEKAKFLGYEIHTLHADDKHDHRGQRCINGSIGLRVPKEVIKTKSAKYRQRGKAVHLTQRVNDHAYSIVSQYQAEYRGIVQYYRMAYNLHTMSYLKRNIELSLVKTLAKKYKTSCQKIYKKFGTTLTTDEGTFKVLEIVVPRPDKPPLRSHFGAVSLKWNKWVAIDDSNVVNIWNQRSEVVERLLAQQCELCNSTESIEVHHIRKLADLKQKGQGDCPKWVSKMRARRRKTLVVCLKCHQDIHYGRYGDGESLNCKDYRKAS